MTAAQTGQYHLGRSSSTCAATGVVLEPGDRYVAVLTEHPESDDLVRLDFTEAAWEGGARPAPPLAVFGHWRARVPHPDEKPRLLVDDDALLDLFEQLAEQTEPRRVAFRFVLALILIRKRLLILESSRAEALLVRPKGALRPPEGPALIEVTDPGLDDETVADVTEQLEAVMAGTSGGTDGDGGTPPPQADSGSPG